MKLELELPIYPAHTHFYVEREIADEHFACDLAACKGACCTMPGGSGAPLLPQEVPLLDQAYAIVEQYLPEKARETVRKKGTWKRELNGDLSVRTIGRNECVFVHWEGDIALCAIQTAYRKGEIEGFEKPISCHLYPIRIDSMAQKDSYLIRYDVMPECDPARAQGNKEYILLTDFLEKPLVRALGNERLKVLLDHLKTNVSD